MGELLRCHAITRQPLPAEAKDFRTDYAIIRYSCLSSEVPDRMFHVEHTCPGYLFITLIIFASSEVLKTHVELFPAAVVPYM